MLKNIGKSFLWLILYCVASAVGVIGAMVVWFANHIDLLNTEDTEVFNAAIDSCINEIAVPSLIVAAIICIITYLVYKLVRKHPFDFKTINWKRAIFCVGIGLLLNCVVSYLVALVSMVLPQEIVDSLNTSTGAVTTGSLPLLIIGTGILVPIMEELIFRYGIHGTLSRSNLVVAYIASSILFGLIHGNLIQGVYAGVLGIVLALLYTKGKNIWYPIFIHITLNTSSCIISVFPEYGDYLMIGIGVIGLIVVALMLWKVEEVRSMFTKQPKQVDTKEDTAEN